MRDEPDLHQPVTLSAVSEYEKERAWHRPVPDPRDCSGPRWQHARLKRTGQRHDLRRQLAGQTESPMTKTTFLIGDDDEDIRTQMKWALAPDYDVIPAEDQGGAMTALTAQRPSVTLLDFGLPPRPNDAEEGLAT